MDRRRYLIAAGGSVLGGVGLTSLLSSRSDTEQTDGPRAETADRAGVAGDGKLLTHTVLDPHPPTTRLGFCGTGDLTGNGREDVVVAGKGPETGLRLFGERTSLPNRIGLQFAAGLGPPTVFWYENPGWQRHDIASLPSVSEGGALGDVTGDGTLDLVLGESIHHTGLYWFESGPDPRSPWTRYRITDEFEMYHDVTFADVDGDGETELVGLSQMSETLFYYDVPDDPRRSPWPESHRRVVMSGESAKGLEVVDIDGDGAPEIVAGTSIYHNEGRSGWRQERFASGYRQPRLSVADLDGDGALEIVLSEGDSPTITGGGPGRLVRFDPPDWEAQVLHEDLFCPHSLATGDLTGNGAPDIVVGEMGLGKNPDASLLVYHNDGSGGFEETVVSRGIPTHEATPADLSGNGRLDVVGKAYRPERHVDVWVNDPPS